MNESLSVGGVRRNVSARNAAPRALSNEAGCLNYDGTIGDGWDNGGSGSVESSAFIAVGIAPGVNNCN